MILITRLLLLFCALLTTGQSLAAAPVPQSSPSATPRQAIRFLAPFSSFPAAAQLELSTAVEQYNRLHPEGSVQLIRRGDQYSSLRELIAMFLAGDTPEIAVIEASEGPAIAQLEIAKPTRLSVRFRAELSRPGAPDLPSLPFLRTIPVLIANAELLAAVPEVKPLGKAVVASSDMPTKNWPRNWAELQALSIAFQESRRAVSPSGAMNNAPLALPLHGSHGLWIFEALGGLPLWRREQGGVRSERRLIPEIMNLQRLLEQGIAKPGEADESATQSFVDRQSLFLIASVDSLPELSRKASFQMLAAPAFTPRDQPASLSGGSDIIVTRDSPEVWAFLTYLYSDPIGPRWSAAGNWIPVVKGWKAAESGPASHVLKTARPTSFRSTDNEVVRARSAWVQALPSLFGKKERRIPPEDALLELDRQLSVR